MVVYRMHYAYNVTSYCLISKKYSCYDTDRTPTKSELLLLAVKLLSIKKPECCNANDPRDDDI